jgi:hypothetical protein
MVRPLKFGVSRDSMKEGLVRRTTIVVDTFADTIHNARSMSPSSPVDSEAASAEYLRRLRPDDRRVSAQCWTDIQAACFHEPVQNIGLGIPAVLEVRDWRGLPVHVSILVSRIRLWPWGR